MPNGERPVIDLFSGAGGFSLGAYLAGFQTALSVDIDYDLTNSYKANFPRSRYRTADLSKIEPENLLRLADVKPGRVAGIFGGPPCQGFSFIGARKLKDPRNSLVTRFFKFVREIKPTFFVMENVLGLLHPPFDKLLTEGMAQVIGRYKVIGPLILNATDFGAATSRSRVFVLGYLPDCMDALTEFDIESIGTKRKPTVYEALHDLPKVRSVRNYKKGELWARYKREPEGGITGAYARKARRAPLEGLASISVRKAHAEGIVSGFQPTKHTVDVLKRFRRVVAGSSDKISRCPRLSWDGLCTTLRAGTGKDKGSYQSIRPIHPEENRVITVREAARLQGFPDWFQFHPTKWHSFRMIGNSVSPYLAQSILSLIRSKIC